MARIIFLYIFVTFFRKKTEFQIHFRIVSVLCFRKEKDKCLTD